MKKQIVIINGSGGVGKDTFVELYSKYTNVLNISSVDLVKKSARQLGWDGGKSEKDRRFLSDLKVLATNYNDHSFNYISDTILLFKTPSMSDTIVEHNILFIHLREPGEIARVKERFPDVITLLITSNRVLSISSNMADANVDNYQYDFTISNDGSIEDLETKAKIFMKLQGKGEA